MRTLVYPPPGVLGLGRYRTVGIIARPLDGVVAYCILTALADQGVPLRVIGDERSQVVHLYALAPTTTADEVRALREFAKVTDAPLRWHPAVGS